MPAAAGPCAGGSEQAVVVACSVQTLSPRSAGAACNWGRCCLADKALMAPNLDSFGRDRALCQEHAKRRIAEREARRWVPAGPLPAGRAAGVAGTGLGARCLSCRTRRRQAREQTGKMADHLEGLSSDDEETSTDITNFNLEKGQACIWKRRCRRRVASTGAGGGGLLPGTVVCGPEVPAWGAVVPAWGAVVPAWGTVVPVCAPEVPVWGPAPLSSSWGLAPTFTPNTTTSSHKEREPLATGCRVGVSTCVIADSAPESWKRKWPERRPVPREPSGRERQSWWGRVARGRPLVRGPCATAARRDSWRWCVPGISRRTPRWKPPFPTVDCDCVGSCRLQAFWASAGGTCFPPLT